jgi:peptidoglycan/LPS O-acetylase OafA/YrhL
MRLRHLDFLRGIAVILVLFRHHAFINNTHNAGWIGVDLFFVLSGFLVSGLLFREYIQLKKVDIKLFLVRRGFKIYPLFYLAILITVIIELMQGSKISKRALLSELVFMQNYFRNLWNHTWSLAVEEHFYFFVALMIVILVKIKKLENVKLFTGIFLLTAFMCLCLRIYNGLYVPFDYPTHLFRTHLRIDSLFFGVILSYYYSFRKESFVTFFQRNYTLLYLMAFVLVLPAFLFDQKSFFMSTVGLTFLYLGFGILLANFVTDNSINKKLDELFSKRLVDAISIIGFCSYAVYLFHMLVHRYIASHIETLWLSFLIFFFGSILIGIIISKTFEVQVLRYRDKWFPKKQKKEKSGLARL